MTLTEYGADLACKFLDQSRHKRAILRNILTKWICNKDQGPECRDGDDPALLKFLSPNKPTQDEKKIINDRLPADKRRSNVIATFDIDKSGGSRPTTEELLGKISDEAQQRDLRVAFQFDALLTRGRDVVYRCVDHLNAPASGASINLQSIPNEVQKAIDELRRAASGYLDALKEPGHASRIEAIELAKQLRNADPAGCLRSIISRDGRILTLSDEHVRAGPLFDVRSASHTNRDEAVSDGEGSAAEDSPCESKISQLFYLWGDCK
jgi:hypothetical protein